MIKFKKLSEKAVCPKKNTSADAGYDLFSVEGGTLKPLERRLFKTDISMAIPQGYYGRVAPRSGLAYKHGIDILAGVVDSGYRGNLGVVVINLGNEDYEIKEGDKIAQLVVETCADFELVEVDELDDSERGEGGYGSSGK